MGFPRDGERRGRRIGMGAGSSMILTRRLRVYAIAESPLSRTGYSVISVIVILANGGASCEDLMPGDCHRYLWRSSRSLHFILIFNSDKSLDGSTNLSGRALRNLARKNRAIILNGAHFLQSSEIFFIKYIIKSIEFFNIN